VARDVFDQKKKKDIAFVTTTAGKIGLLDNDFYYIKSLEFVEEELVPIQFPTPVYSSTQKDSAQKRLSVLADAYYQTALYLLLNNKR